ncbi:MAG: L-seryl-tRNA(Sec) selenium transferase, partial [Planctomycetota bacterium]
ARALAEATRPAYARVLNATGVILHTGLGRAPIAPAAAARLAELARGFALLEVERQSGKRGQRDTGITAIVRELTGAEAACVVNNNAGATLIALAALARGRPVVVSRGQLVEIGGSFRIPEVMEQSGARLVEVGATNRTHLADYERALDAHPEAALLLRVHTSNFQVVGFTKEVSLEELVALGRARGVEVMDDLGSGCLVDLSPYGLPREPVVGESLRAGAGIVTFSGDKLLGGPQAGIIVGRRALVERVRRHPLYRALRPDKLTLGALEATLSLYRDPERLPEVLPVLRMISASPASLAERARAMAARLQGLDGLAVSVEEATSRVGGGSYAVSELPTWVVRLRPSGRSVDTFAEGLRLADPPLFARVHEGALQLDPRTLLGPEEDAEACSLVRRACAAS